MQITDVAIVGGGLAGSTAAAMLGRAGIDTILIDPHSVYPPDFRCEKLDRRQVAIFRRTGIADSVLLSAAPATVDWIARYGHVVEKRRSDQHGIRYEDLVNAVRAQIPPSVAFVTDKVTAIEAEAERQTVTTADGTRISARLVVLANGLNTAIRRNFGMERQELSPAHSITVGFDVRPVGAATFSFGALAYYPERIDRMAYLSIFPVAGTMRANFMTYRDMRDPWLARVRKEPEAALLEEMPGLTRITGPFEVVGPVKIRPADLYQTTGYLRPGVVLVGDAFATSCPAAGTGTTKVFTDVERLCNIYIPRWLASEGMGIDKVAAFYEDPVKRGADAKSRAKAFSLKSLSTDRRLRWSAIRLLRLATQLCRGALWPLRERRASRPFNTSSTPPSANGHTPGPSEHTKVAA